MKIKKSFFTFLAITALCSHNTHIAGAKTTFISITEQTYNNTKFKHVIKSNELAEEYFVNGIPLLEDDYYKKIDVAEQLEREQTRKKETELRRQKIDFSVNAQNKITAKLILKTIKLIEAISSKLEHPALVNYILFSSKTIASQDELEELISVISYTKREIPKLIESRDSSRLEFYENKLTPYPEKLELLFRSSINEAIETCDSTSALKELLTLVAE